MKRRVGRTEHRTRPVAIAVLDIDHCGIDARSQTLPDMTGRPIHLLDQGEPIRELVNV